MSRQIGFTVEFDWDYDGTFTDESDYVVGFNVDRSLSGVGKPFSGSTGRIGRVNIELSNTTNRFSSRITTGALYSYLQNGGFYGIPVRITLTTNSVTYRIFTGICTIPTEPQKSVNRRHTVTVIALTREELLRNNRIDLSVTKTKEWLDSQPDESTAIEYIIDSMGYSGNFDPGVFPVLPLYTNQSALEVIWNIARSAGGLFFTDVNGNFTFRNFNTLLSLSSEHTFTNANVSNIEMAYDEINVSSKVIVTFTDTFLSFDQTIYESKSPIIIEANDEITFEVEFSNYVYEIDSETFTCVSGSGIDLVGDLTITKTVSSKGMSITFTNSGSVRMYCTYSLIGTIIETETKKVSAESSDSYWDDRGVLVTPLSLSYLSGEGYAQSIADLILSRQEIPSSQFLITDAIYDGSLDLLDLITISDSSLSSSSIECVITGLNYSFSSQGGCRLRIVATEYGTLYPYLSEGYFIVGTNELGTNPSDDIARIIY